MACFLALLLFPVSMLKSVPSSPVPVWKYEYLLGFAHCFPAFPGMQLLSAREDLHLGAGVINPGSLYQELSKSPLSKVNSNSMMVRDLIKSPF